MATPRARSSLSDRIAEDLAGRILAGEFDSGDRLPTESALAVHYDAGRSAIREAIARLRRDGIVVTRQGAGAFVRESGGNVFRIEDHPSQQQIHALYELRAAVESGAAALAAQRATPEMLQRLRGCYRALEEATAGESEGQEADLAFHLIIAEAGGNDLFLSLLKLLDSQILKQIALARAKSSREAGLPGRVLLEHKAILEAIEARDPAAARQAALDHIRNACGRLGSGEIAL